MLNGFPRADRRHRRADRPPARGRAVVEVGAPLPLKTSVDPAEAEQDRLDIVQEWGEQSFPASDPPANW